MQFFDLFSVNYGVTIIERGDCEHSQISSKLGKGDGNRLKWMEKKNQKNGNAPPLHSEKTEH